MKRSDRYQKTYDLTLLLEKGILDLEQSLILQEAHVPDLLGIGTELRNVLPLHRGFARERAVRVVDRVKKLEQNMIGMRKDFQILQRLITKIRSESDALFLPPPPSTIEKLPPAAAIADGDTIRLLENADYTLFRLGTMRFCVFAKPLIIGLAPKTESVDLIFPDPVTLQFFTRASDESKFMIFENGQTKIGIYYDEILPPTIKKDNKVAMGSAGVSNDWIQGRFNFKGLMYYLVKFPGQKAAESEFAQSAAGQGTG